ncbi:hypothetical protein M413DRAFT_75729, partial [Hebeloma cylindrosporum]
AWIAACDKLGIDITAKGAQNTVRNHRKQHNQASSAADPEDLRKRFTPEAFVDAIVDFIVSDDQSINVIESPKLRAIFLMLREDLKDSDIPHRTTIRKRIMEVWDEHLDTLQDQMKAFLQVLDRIGITSKIGWVTMDNASNNDTFMSKLEEELKARNVPFDKVGRRIRSVTRQYLIDY